MDTFNIIALLSVSILFILIASIQIYYQKKKIKQLENAVKKHLQTIKNLEYVQAQNQEEIKILKWKIKNPPKYKKGDVFGNYVIISYELHKPSISNILAQAAIKLISILAGYYPKIFALDWFWEYELINSTNGEKKKIKELEIPSLSFEKK